VAKYNISVSLSYIDSGSSSFKYVASTVRKVKCQECNVSIPKNVPKFHYYRPWNYYSGFYCLKCSKQKLNNKIHNWTFHLNQMKETLIILKSMSKKTELEMNRKGYKEHMALEEL